MMMFARFSDKQINLWFASQREREAREQLKREGEKEKLLSDLFYFCQFGVKKTIHFPSQIARLSAGAITFR